MTNYIPAWLACPIGQSAAPVSQRSGLELESQNSPGFLLATAQIASLSVHRAPVVQKVDSAIHRINHHPVDSAISVRNTYPTGRDLSGGQRYPTFAQPLTVRYSNRQFSYIKIHSWLRDLGNKTREIPCRYRVNSFLLFYSLKPRSKVWIPEFRQSRRCDEMVLIAWETIAN